MLDINPEKLLVLAAVAILVLGPGRIPQLARSLARARNGIRQLTSAVPPEVVAVTRQPRQALADAVAQPRRSVTEPGSALAEAIAGFTLPSGPGMVTGDPKEAAPETTTRP